MRRVVAFDRVALFPECPRLPTKQVVILSPMGDAEVVRPQTPQSHRHTCYLNRYTDILSSCCPIGENLDLAGFAIAPVGALDEIQLNHYDALVFY